MGELDRREIVEKIRQRIAHEAFSDPIQRERFQQYLTIVALLLNELVELGIAECGSPVLNQCGFR